MGESSAQSEPRRKISKQRRRLFSLFLLLGLSLFQELAFRIVFPIPETTRFNRIRYQLLAEADPRFQPLMKRGLVYDKILFESSPDGWKHVHRLNRFGFRERDFSITPPTSKKRVLVVGDSVTEGQGASADKTIPAELGRLLGNGYEVLNLGVVAASLDKVTQLACDSTALLKPDTVVLVLNANDVVAPPSVPQSTAMNDVLYATGKTLQDVSLNESSFILPRLFVIVKRVLTNEPVYSRFFTKTIRYFAPTPDSTNPFKTGAPPMQGLKPELEVAMRAGQLNPWLIQQSTSMPSIIRFDLSVTGSPGPHLRRIQDLCQNLGVKLVIAYIPFHATVHARYAQAMVELTTPEPIAKGLSIEPAFKSQAPQLKNICDRLKIYFMDTTPALSAKEARDQPQFWAYDSHPRPAGYATIAEEIARAFVK